MNGARLRDNLIAGLPWWLRPRLTEGKTVGFKFLWSMVAPLDAALDVLMQGVIASWPGLGTPTALSWSGRSRGILRGENETNESFAARQRAWLTKWQTAGTAERLAREIQEHVANHPRIRIVTRSGYWVTLNQDGSVTRYAGGWVFDTNDHPERAGYWSDLWIIAYPTQWADTTGTWGDGSVWGADGFAADHAAPTPEVEAIRGLVMQWKAAHTRVRALIWTSDASLFDPTSPPTLPDGEWGAWGTTNAGARVASHRNLSTCRYWEF